MDDFALLDEQEADTRSDPRQDEAVEGLRELFREQDERVFFSRQLEVMHEGRWFHWVTNRALRQLESEGDIRGEVRQLATGGFVRLLWHRSYRYPRRQAQKVVDLVEEYSDPNIGGALGLQGEAMILEGFAGKEFVMRGRETRSFRGRQWSRTAHDLDFIFERDGLAYGVEVKNTLGYMEYADLKTKMDLCHELQLAPVFAVRMLPKTWINEVVTEGGFALILKYQLYPWAHRALAQRVNRELDLPVDVPRRLTDGTMARFVRWHDGRTL